MRLQSARREKPAAKFRIGTQLACPITDVRLTVVGVPSDCEYLPTGTPVYLCCEDTLDRKVVVIPASQVETDLVEVQTNPVRDRMVPGFDRRSGDRRTSNGTRRE